MSFKSDAHRRWWFAVGQYEPPSQEFIEARLSFYSRNQDAISSNGVREDIKNDWKIYRSQGGK